jgi:hypothetical protein
MVLHCRLSSDSKGPDRLVCGVGGTSAPVGILQIPLRSERERREKHKRKAEKARRKGREKHEWKARKAIKAIRIDGEKFVGMTANGRRRRKEGSKEGSKGKEVKQEGKVRLVGKSGKSRNGRQKGKENQEVRWESYKANKDRGRRGTAEKEKKKGNEFSSNTCSETPQRLIDSTKLLMKNTKETTVLSR